MDRILDFDPCILQGSREGKQNTGGCQSLRNDFISHSASITTSQIPDMSKLLDRDLVRKPVKLSRKVPVHANLVEELRREILGLL